MMRRSLLAAAAVLKGAGARTWLMSSRTLWSQSKASMGADQTVLLKKSPKEEASKEWLYDHQIARHNAYKTAHREAMRAKTIYDRAKARHDRAKVRYEEAKAEYIKAEPLHSRAMARSDEAWAKYQGAKERYQKAVAKAKVYSNLTDTFAMLTVVGLSMMISLSFR